MFGFTRPAATALVRRYVSCLNARDIDGVTALLHADACLIDRFGERIEGRPAAVAATQQFFDLEPRFHLAIDTIVEHDGDVLLRGTATATRPELAGAAMWRATLEGGRIICWQSFGPDEQAHLVKLLGGTG